MTQEFCRHTSPESARERRSQLANAWRLRRCRLGLVNTVRGGLMLYRDMTLGRRFEISAPEKLYYRGKMFAPCIFNNGRNRPPPG